MTTPVARPPIPSISISLIIQRREKLISECQEFLGRQLIAETYQAFVDKLHKHLPDLVLRQTVHNSVIGLLKKELTLERLQDLAWRLAGNFERLKDQQAVTEWNGQYEFEWIPVRVDDVRIVRRSGSLVNLFTFQSLGGTVVPRKIIQAWSFKKTNYLAVYRNPAGHGFGFSRSHVNKRGEQLNKGLYSNLNQFYGLRCFLLLDPSQSKNEPFAVEIGHSGATTTYNRRLISQRDRRQTACIKGFTNGLECFACPYGLDRCILATHAETYHKGNCNRCKQLGLFDPLEIEYAGLCVLCAQNERKA